MAACWGGTACLGSAILLPPAPRGQQNRRGLCVCVVGCGCGVGVCGFLSFFFNVRKHLECLFIFLYSLYNDCIPMVRQFAGSCCSFLLQPYFQMLHSCPVLWSAGTHSWVTLNCPVHGLRPQRVQKAWTETEERWRLSLLSTPSHCLVSFSRE